MRNASNKLKKTNNYVILVLMHGYEMKNESVCYIKANDKSDIYLQLVAQQCFIVSWKALLCVIPFGLHVV